MDEPRQKSLWADIDDSFEIDEDQPDTERTNHTDSIAHPTPNPPISSGQVTLKLSNLPYKIRRHTEIQKFLGLSPVQAASVYIRIQMKGGRSTGIAFVEASTDALASKVEESRGKVLLGREVKISRVNSGSSRVTVTNKHEKHQKFECKGKAYEKKGCSRERRGEDKKYRRTYTQFPPKTEKSGRKPSRFTCKTDRKSNPFAGAKPVDTNQKDLEFEINEAKGMSWKYQSQPKH